MSKWFPNVWVNKKDAIVKPKMSWWHFVTNITNIKIYSKQLFKKLYFIILIKNFFRKLKVFSFQKWLLNQRMKSNTFPSTLNEKRDLGWGIPVGGAFPLFVPFLSNITFAFQNYNNLAPKRKYIVILSWDQINSSTNAMKLY